MSEQEISILMRNVQKLETCSDYERDNFEVMEYVHDAYTEYQNVLSYN